MIKKYVIILHLKVASEAFKREYQTASQKLMNTLVSPACQKINAEDNEDWLSVSPLSSIKWHLVRPS